MSFSKSIKIAWAQGSTIWAFWKTHECKIFPNLTRKAVWLLIYEIIHEKKKNRKNILNLALEVTRAVVITHNNTSGSGRKAVFSRAVFQIIHLIQVERPGFHEQFFNNTSGSRSKGRVFTSSFSGRLASDERKARENSCFSNSLKVKRVGKQEARKGFLLM